MITCQQFVDGLVDHTDADRADFDAHQAACSNCQRFAATYQAVPLLVKRALSAEPGAAPADVADDVLQTMLDETGIDARAREAMQAEFTEHDQSALEEAILAEMRKQA